MAEPYLISQVADILGTSTKMVRLFADSLPHKPRRLGPYRIFSEQDVAAIKRALAAHRPYARKKKREVCHA
jgi:DNA-binding transcriptional MerR regulator